jgi:hypothetical protein
LPLNSTQQAKLDLLDSLIKQFESDFGQFSIGVKQQLTALLRRGPIDRELLTQAFAESGYEQMVGDFISKYDEVIKFTGEIAKDMGLKFTIPERSLAILEMIQEQNAGIMIASSESIKNSLLDAGLRYVVEGQPLDVIISDMMGEITDFGRRLQTEAFTGASIFDRTLRGEFFKEAGIELFVYVGPDDEVTRDVCREVLHDPRQQTGWTMEDIQNSPVSFIECAGWNCRHDFLPFIKEIDT